MCFILSEKLRVKILKTIYVSQYIGDGVNFMSYQGRGGVRV